MQQGLLAGILYFISSVSYGQKQEQVLFNAYKAKSIEQLHMFYKNWASEIPPIKDSDLGKNDDTIKNIYSIYKSFYNPKDISRIGGSEWGNDIYKNVEFLLTQDKIEYGFVDTLDKELLIKKEIFQMSGGNTMKIDSLLKIYRHNPDNFERSYLIWPTYKKLKTLYRFRPKLSFLNVQTLALTSKYKELLNQFLGNSHYALGSGDIMSPARASGESDKRKKFLENYIKIWYGHWGGYWQFYSYPYISALIFDHSFDHALIYFTMVYEGGYAYLKKINGIWTLIDANRTWIE
jgi:hypothetical protein